MSSLLHALPVLDFLRQVVSGCEVHWLADEPCRDVLAGNPLIRRLHLTRLEDWRKRPHAPATWRGISALRRQLREQPFDIAFDLQGDLRSGLLLSLAGVADRVGFDRENVKEVVNLLFTTRQVPHRRVDSHLADRYLRLVSVPFGKDFRGMHLCSDIWTAPEDDAVAEALMATLADGFVFLFQHGTGWPTKSWHDTGWIELGKRLLATYADATILLACGSEKEQEVALRLAAAIGPGARVMDRYPFKTFVAILKRVDLMLGPDTGPLHAAAAVGTPTVSFYRASDGRSSGPRGERHVLVQAPVECSRCFQTSCSRDLACRESIGADLLFGAVQRLMVPSTPGKTVP
jgi:heptosyltransferase-1